VVDLNPSGFTTSNAIAVSGATQVGVGRGPGTGVNTHALLWNDTAASAVDLHPSGFDSSGAREVSGASQVGYGCGSATGGLWHALLWSGTAASVVDLHPTGFDESNAAGVSAAGQVGSGSGPATGGYEHALMWSGTAASAVDLHSLLSGLGPTFISSFATAISEDGLIVGAAQAANGGYYAVLWTSVVPEPSSCTLVACGLAVTSIVRLRRRR
jgi:hypothetical protein